MFYFLFNLYVHDETLAQSQMIFVWQTKFMEQLTFQMLSIIMPEKNKALLNILHMKLN